MENVFYEGKVMWSQIDANMHLRHSAYADFAAQARLEILEKLGFDANLLEKLFMKIEFIKWTNYAKKKR